MQDLLYVGLSFGFVFAVLGLSTLLQNLRWLNEEGSRKLVHIAVSNWILFLFLFQDLIYALIPPVAFILLNYLSLRKNIFKAIERGGKGDLGTVYFPISLFILTLFTFLIGTDKEYAYIAVTGILVLGYGDGFAAVIGTQFGRTKLVSGKSLEGSLTMFVASLIVIFLMLALGQPSLLVNAWFLVPLLALGATVIELFTPNGLDNLSVPLLTAALFYGFVALLA